MPAWQSSCRDCTAATLLHRARITAVTGLGLVTAGYAAAIAALWQPRDSGTWYGAAHGLTLAALACFVCFAGMTATARGRARSVDRTWQPPCTAPGAPRSTDLVFWCICCNATSPHPDDIAHSYCARCHWFAADPEPPGRGHLDLPCPAREYRL